MNHIARSDRQSDHCPDFGIMEHDKQARKYACGLLNGPTAFLLSVERENQ